MRLKQKQQYNNILTVDVSASTLINVERSIDNTYKNFEYCIAIDVNVSAAQRFNACLIDIALLKNNDNKNESLWVSSKGTKVVESANIVDDVNFAQQMLKSSTINKINNLITTSRISIKNQYNTHNNKSFAINTQKIIKQNPKITKAATLDAVIDSAFNVANLHNKLQYKNTTKLTHINEFTRHYVNVTINANDLANCSKFHVTAKLINGDGIFVDNVEFDIEHIHLLSVFETPIIPPIATIVNVSAAHNIIALKQIDPSGSSIKIYKRSLTQSIDINDVDSNQYIFVADVQARAADGYIRIVDTANNSNTTIYRLISVGFNGSISRTFTNIVVKGLKQLGSYKRQRSTISAFTIEKNDIGVIATVTNIALNVVAISLYRRLANEGNFICVSDTIKLVSTDVNIKFTDSTVKNEKSYEYKLMLYMDDGTSLLSTTSVFYEHIISSDIGIQINVTDPIITQVRGSNNDQAAKYDVKFSIVSTIMQTQDDILYESLKKLGVTEIFGGELDEIRDKFAKIVAHGVKRVNLNNGYIEDFGIITATTFSDIEFGKRRAVKTLSAGVNYRYMITTFVRTPEALFDDFTKVKTSQSKFDASVAGKLNLTTLQHTFKPSKSLHPSIAKTGAISNTAKRALLHARDELSYGALGNIYTVDVTIPTRTVNISAVNITKIGTHLISITWHIIGDPKCIDHFVINYNNEGVQHFVAVVHALNDTSTFEYIHKINDFEHGIISYSVFIVATNFTNGQSVESDKVVI